MPSIKLIASSRLLVYLGLASLKTLMSLSRIFDRELLFQGQEEE